MPAPTLAAISAFAMIGFGKNQQTVFEVIVFCGIVFRFLLFFRHSACVTKGIKD